MKRLGLIYLVIAALVLSAAFMACGSGGSSGSGKKLSGTYVGYVSGDLGSNKISVTFSGNKIKIMINGVVQKEGVYELVEEYKEDDFFSRGTIIITDREGKEEANYTLMRSKGEIFEMWGCGFIKGGKSVKIPSGTYSGDYYDPSSRINRLDKVSLVFSGNNLIRTDDRGNKNEYTYEFIVGYEEKGISKGYLLLRDENGEQAENCVLEKDKMQIKYTVCTKE